MFALSKEYIIEQVIMKYNFIGSLY